MSEGTHLPGLRGDTPDGFLAGLGVLAAYDGDPDPPRLWWDGTHAVVDDRFTIQRIAGRALAALRKLSDSPAMVYKIDGKPIEDVKFKDRADTKSFLDPSHGDKMPTCLTAEGAYDQTKDKKAKPTAWDFTAGKQGFIKKYAPDCWRHAQVPTWLKRWKIHTLAKRPLRSRSDGVSQWTGWPPCRAKPPPMRRRSSATSGLKRSACSACRFTRSSRTTRPAPQPGGRSPWGSATSPVPESRESRTCGRCGHRPHQPRQ